MIIKIKPLDPKVVLAVKQSQSQFEASLIILQNHAKPCKDESYSHQKKITRMVF